MKRPPNVVVIWILLWAVMFTAWVGVVWVACHYIRKFW